MFEKGHGGDPGGRPSRRPAPSARLDPARFQQDVQGAPAGGDASNFLDFGAGDRLMIGDDRERLDGGARQLAGDIHIAPQHIRQIPGRAHGPAVGDSHQIDPAPGVGRLELGEQRLDVGILRQKLGQAARVKRRAGGEQQGLENTQALRVLAHGVLSALRRYKGAKGLA